MWVQFFETEGFKNYVKKNPNIIFKLMKNNTEQSELVFTKTFDHLALMAFLKRHNQDSKTEIIDSYTPPFPTEDIWPALKSKESFLYIGGLKAVSFEISEQDFNKIIASESVKVLVQTEGKPLIGEIHQDAIPSLKEFKNICWSSNPKALLEAQK